MSKSKRPVAVVALLIAAVLSAQAPPAVIDARCLRLVVIRCGYPDRCCLTCRRNHPCGESLSWIRPACPW
jgi:hypothetical protein